jgi:hypothetical protein
LAKLVEAKILEAKPHFESSTFFNTIKEAAQAAAKIALV